MTGQAVTIAQGFEDALGLTGIVMSAMDGDALGGAAFDAQRDRVSDKVPRGWRGHR